MPILETSAAAHIAAISAPSAGAVSTTQDDGSAATS